MLTVLQHPLLSCDLTTIRNVSTSPTEFRIAIDRIALYLAVECYKLLPTNEIQVQTPLELTKGCKPIGRVHLLPILRAGISLVHSFLSLYPTATIGYLGLKRNEDSLQPSEYYANLPTISPDDIVIILDPMIATGGSICKALEHLSTITHHRTIIASVISAPEGIDAIHRRFGENEITIVTSALDRELNDHGYIMPGLGDAGDRIHGTL
jgi:uracil phosphoribosyltransferase